MDLGLVFGICSESFSFPLLLRAFGSAGNRTRTSGSIMEYREAMGHFFSEHFGFPCQFSFYKLLHAHLSSGAGKIDQLATDVTGGLSFIPPRPTKKKTYLMQTEHFE
jgi:hypothetical protein